MICPAENKKIMYLCNHNFNSTIDDDFGKKRINCGQVCQLNRCHYCDMAIRYDEIALKYKENKLEKENSN